VVEDGGGVVFGCTDALSANLKDIDRQAEADTFHDPTSSTVSLPNYTVNLSAPADIYPDLPESASSDSATA